MKKILLWLLLVLSAPLFSQVNSNNILPIGDPGLRFISNIVYPNFPVYDTAYPKSPYTGGWITFAGNNNVLRVGHNPFICDLTDGLTDTFSIEIVFGSTNAKSDYYIGGSAAAGANPGWIVYVNSRVVTWEFGGVTFAGGTLPNDTLFHSIWARYNKARSRTLTLYIDSVLSHAAYTGINTTNTTQTATNQAFVIGNIRANETACDNSCVLTIPLYSFRGKMSSFLFSKNASNGSPDSTKFWNFSQGYTQSEYEQSSWFVYDRPFIDTSNLNIYHALSGSSIGVDTLDIGFIFGSLKLGYTPRFETMFNGITEWASNLQTHCTFWGSDIQKIRDTLYMTFTGNEGNGTFSQDIGYDTLRGVAYWDQWNIPNKWKRKGYGVKENFNTFVCTVDRIASFNDATLGNTLVIVGAFDTLVGVGVAHNVAEFDNAGNWQAVGSGTNGATQMALDIGGGKIVLGGFFTTPHPHITIYNSNTASFDSLRGGLDLNVTGMILIGDKLHVVGNFTAAYNNNVPVTVNRYAIYDLTNKVWTAGIGSGMDDETFEITAGSNGDIMIGGKFTTVNGVSAKGLVRINGGAVYGGFDIAGGTAASVSSIFYYKGVTYAGGLFMSVNGVSCKSICAITGWSNVYALDYGVGMRIEGLSVANDTLYWAGDSPMASGIHSSAVGRYIIPY